MKILIYFKTVHCTVLKTHVGTIPRIPESYDVQYFMLDNYNGLLSPTDLIVKPDCDRFIPIFHWLFLEGFDWLFEMTFDWLIVLPCDSLFVVNSDWLYRLDSIFYSDLPNKDYCTIKSTCIVSFLFTRKHYKVIQYIPNNFSQYSSFFQNSFHISFPPNKFFLPSK